MTDVNRDTPFFVVGVQRSGTTMLRLMLNAHPSIAVPFEWAFLKPLADLGAFGDLALRANAERLLHTLADDKLARKGQLITDIDAILAEPIASYGDLVAAVLRVYARQRGKERYGVKTPSYSAEIDRIHAILPDARIIHIVRDGRDVAVSNRGVSWGSSHIVKVAREWRWQVLVGRKLGNMLGERYLEIRYEDLVQAPEQQLRRTCAFLDVDYDPAMLNYHETAAAEMPADSLRWHANSVAAPDESKVQAWRHTLPVTDQLLFEETAGDALELFGYPRAGAKAGLALPLKRVYYAVVKRW